MNIRIINPSGIELRRIRYCGDGCCSWFEYESVDVGDEFQIDIVDNAVEPADNNVVFFKTADFYIENGSWEVI